MVLVEWVDRGVWSKVTGGRVRWGDRVRESRACTQCVSDVVCLMPARVCPHGGELDGSPLPGVSTMNLLEGLPVRHELRMSWRLG